MNMKALLTSAGINVAICVVLLILYSLLRKQPGLVAVYFGRKLAQVQTKRQGHLCFNRFVPSPSWIVKAWTTPEEELLAIGGLDAVVFIRIVVFSIRIFSIATGICMFLVLPLNYFGNEMKHAQFHSESLDVFTIGNVNAGSTWFGGHCFALYVISCSSCALLYLEYKSITKMRLAHFTGSAANPSHFAVLIRSVPRSPLESYSDSVKNYFTNYHAATYLSHQMVYRNGAVQKLLSDAESMYRKLKSAAIDPSRNPSLIRCGVCAATNSFEMRPSELDFVNGKTDQSADSQFNATDEECTATALVFFKSRYAAAVATQVLQSSNPMIWVTDLAPEPGDVYWSNLCIPYRQLWIRRIATLVAAIIFMFLFLIPITFVQGLTQLDSLQRMFPFLQGLLKKKFVSQLATGYLPSVILIISLYIVPPVMMLFSAVEGSISRSGRKRSAACKVLYFTIWNVFFVNVLSGTLIARLNAIASPKDIPTVLAGAVTKQASFFMTYVMTSGWASLAAEIIQLFSLICTFFRRFILKKQDGTSGCITFTFPYQTEVPKLLLFGLLGFTCSILAPLILPLLLIYFVVAYLVYKNQILNVYVTKYESGGLLWPVVHNTTIFSLVLTQLIALGMFGLKRSPIASGFTIPLIICTLLFNEYCRQRFLPIFKNNVAEDLIEMDRQDEQNGRMEEIYQKLHAAYCQFTLTSHEARKAEDSVCCDDVVDSARNPEDVKPGNGDSNVREPSSIHCKVEEPSEK